MAELEERHISQLHALAAKAGVPRFRMLRRAELAEALRERGVAEDDVAEPSAAADRPRRRRRERAPAKEAPAPAEERPETEEEPAEREEEPTEPVRGILDVLPQRYGFLRLEGLESSPGDVYISASQIRRCELRPGDEVSGPARAARRGERHRALVHVDAVSGLEDPGAQRPRLEDLTPVPPSRRLPLDGVPGGGDEALVVRAADLLAPMAYGQRVLVQAAARSGRTTLLRGIARAIAAADGPEPVVLLVDERPEEATLWRTEVPDAELAIAPADMRPDEQARVAELALARAKRLAEQGTDAVLIVDSLSRLVSAGGDAAAAKRLFGSGRDLAEEGAGSLTVIATVLGADEAQRAVLTTENALITLDPDLAAAGVVPALDVSSCEVSDEGRIRSAEELDAARRLRGLLAELDAAEAARSLRERVESAPGNADVLRSI